ncbi:GNAT family N-acetyltransferase, partial [bacterium]|nr:GNAT family N-acetyltransferase [bacterium]
MDTIRKIVFNDLIEIIGLEKKIFDDSWSSKIIQNQIKNLEAINLAVIQDSRIIAYIFSRIYIDFIEIERVGVIKSERRNKVGEKLMKELENIAYVKNKRKITLEVAENNFS